MAHRTPRNRELSGWGRNRKNRAANIFRVLVVSPLIGRGAFSGIVSGVGDFPVFGLNIFRVLGVSVIRVYGGEYPPGFRY